MGLGLKRDKKKSMPLSSLQRINKLPLLKNHSTDIERSFSRENKIIEIWLNNGPIMPLLLNPLRKDSQKILQARFGLLICPNMSSISNWKKSRETKKILNLRVNQKNKSKK